MRVPPLAFFITKYFGSGVIIATAFIHVSKYSLMSQGHVGLPAWIAACLKGHWIFFALLPEFNVLDTKTIQLLAPANNALTSPCLSGPITQYSWVEGIALMTVFVMFFIELLAARFDAFGQQEHDLEASDPSKDLMREKYSDTKSALQICEYHLRQQNPNLCGLSLQGNYET